MQAPMITYASAARARRTNHYCYHARCQKIQMRRSARRRDRQAVREGRYDAIHRGQSDLNLS